MKPGLYFFEYHNSTGGLFFYQMRIVKNNELLSFDIVALNHRVKKKLTEKTYRDYFKGTVRYSKRSASIPFYDTCDSVYCIVDGRFSREVF